MPLDKKTGESVKILHQNVANHNAQLATLASVLEQQGVYTGRAKAIVDALTGSAHAVTLTSEKLAGLPVSEA